MKVQYECASCEHKSRIITASSNEIGKRLLPKFDCPKCGAEGAFERLMSSMHYPVNGTTTVDEFMFYVAGLANPGEVVTQKEAVVAMLRAHNVIDVDAESLNDRCVIHSMLLDNNVRLHFAASGMGSVVWKATRVKGEEDARNSERSSKNGQ